MDNSLFRKAKVKLCPNVNVSVSKSGLKEYSAFELKKRIVN